MPLHFSSFRAGLARAAIFSLTLAACGRAGLDVYDGPGAAGGSGGATSSTSKSSSKSGSSTSSGTSGGGAGGQGPCLVAQECEDNNPCTSNKCEGGQCTFPERDDDADGFVAAVCGGTDCNDLNPNVFPGHPEDCHDGADNDCNGVADCMDPACSAVPDCGCVPKPGGENCSNGQDDDCDTKVDCNDPDCQGTPACGCLASEVGHCQNGFDDDCDGQLDCADNDCSSTPACQCQIQPEICSDGVDNNCDGLVDCAEPSCQGVFPCACVPPGFPEVCNDGVDNDCDGKPDCQDPDCNLSPSCQQCTSEVCTDGLDNNCNGQIDCADVACFGAPSCAPKPEVCNNGLDDDQDGLIDCQDPDCSNNPFCEQQQANCLSPKLIPGSGTYFGDTTGHVNETHGACGGGAGEAVFYMVITDPSFVELDSIGTSFDSVIYVRTGVCNTGRELGCDDDSANSANAAQLTFNIVYPGTYYVFLDGFTVDPNFGANEGPFQLNVTITPNPPEKCHDGIDNDGDVLIDCADPDCTFDGSCFKCNGGNDPEPEFAPGRCTDGLDNDCDGKIDCADSDCHASDVYVSECCDGVDQNQNNIIDDFACRCATTADCANGQICFNDTVHACGPPCNQIFGMICPFVAPGSFCNMTTGQCEFP